MVVRHKFNMVGHNFMVLRHKFNVVGHETSTLQRQQMHPRREGVLNTVQDQGRMSAQDPARTGNKPKAMGIHQLTFARIKLYSALHT